MNNIIPFTGLSYADVPVEDVLNGAKEWDFEQVVVIGLTKTGEIEQFFSTSSVPEINWMIDLAKNQLLEGTEE